METVTEEDWRGAPALQETPVTSAICEPANGAQLEEGTDEVPGTLLSTAWRLNACALQCCAVLCGALRCCCVLCAALHCPAALTAACWQLTLLLCCAGILCCLLSCAVLCCAVPCLSAVRCALQHCSVPLGKRCFVIEHGSHLCCLCECVSFACAFIENLC